MSTHRYAIYLGIDIGAVGLKAALVIPQPLVRTLPDRRGLTPLLRPLQPNAKELFQDPVLGEPRGPRPVALRRTETVSKGNLAVLVAPYRRTRGRPIEAAQELLSMLLDRLGADEIAGITVTGTGSLLLGKLLGVSRCNEFQAIARAVDLLHPQVRTVFEIGGETSKYIRLEPDPGSSTLGILDYGTNGDCAAGTGSFLDQQALRLQYAVEEIGPVVQSAKRAAQIAGRCSVFAKSDMIHAQQKGFTPPEVLRGLCNAVAANFKSAIVRGRAPQPPIALIGGVSANTAVVQALREAFELDDGALFVPEAAESLAAIGAALIASEAARESAPSVHKVRRDPVVRLAGAAEGGDRAFPTSPPLSLERVTLLRDRVPPYKPPDPGSRVDAYLGLDIGSVGTKLVLIDAHGDVIHSIFTRTDGRPIEVVSRCLRELEQAVGAGVRVCGVGSTGSGRELVGELVGADSINDEITAHKTGATFVGDRLLGRRPDTIFEIGGQDSKYIRLQPEGGDSTETVVVDFTMNDACAAGTGSFLEERAEELGVSIKGEFANLALGSTAPVKLGERCTVFMERDVNSFMQRGARREDVIAGLAYSIAYNYINRVVRGRPIGDCVFFQGGTAYNDAVAAAFSAVTGKTIIVPPHNAVLGAIGAALLAKEKISATGARTRFRGYDLGQVNYTLREFTCKACGNHCAVQAFTVEGEKTFWGDKCSDRYRKRAKTDRKPVICDLVALRRRLLDADDQGEPDRTTATDATIGIPMAMYAYDQLPLWRRFFLECGFRVVVSPETNQRIVQQGLDCVVAEPCFPIMVAHGHVAELIRQGVDYIWLPSILSAETKFLDNESYVCPWGQTLPFVIRRAPHVDKILSQNTQRRPRFHCGTAVSAVKTQARRLCHSFEIVSKLSSVGKEHSAFRTAQSSIHDRILCPVIRMRKGTDHVRHVLVETARSLGVRRSVARRAFDAALAAQRRFQQSYEQAGRQALATLERTGESGMVLVGRPYNVHDAGVSLSVARKLREHYGVNVLPVDALPVSDVDVQDVNDNMYWEYGRKILAAAKIVARHPNLHIIYITNFKCGPDSFIKGFIRPASGKPFLTLQFDGHSNDAGMMTRCEAYLDSKGILRWWRQPTNGRKAGRSRAEPSTSRRCPTPAPV